MCDESENRTGEQGPVVAKTSGRDGFTRPDALYNDRPAQTKYSRESPQHRVMIMLKAQGFTNREIATALDVSPVTVSQVLRQPWARARLLDIFEQRGMSRVDALLSAEAIASLQTIVELRDEAAVPPAVRLASANSLLDRYLGKPKEKIEVKNETTLIDARAVEDELSRLSAEEAALMGRGVRGN